MPVFRGVGVRLKQRLRDLGFVKANGDLDVSTFCIDHRYVGTVFYDFLADRRTPIRDLERIATDLKTTPAWLLFGVSEVAPPAVVIEAKAVTALPTGRARRSDRALPVRRAPTRRRQAVTAKALPAARARRGRDIMLGSWPTQRVPRAA